MANKYAELMFTPAVKEAQQLNGSRKSYERLERAPGTSHDRLGPKEIEFIRTRDSFYMATVSQDGWPYIQHRGGPRGFLKVIDERTIGFADFRGNRQYISVGNLVGNDRVSLILVDYPNGYRLKVAGRARWIDASASADMVELTRDPDYRAVIERILIIRVEAYDWNCPQHITPRYTDAEIDTLIAPLIRKIDELERALVG